MRWIKAIGLLVLTVFMAASCGKDEQRDQEIQKAIEGAVQKERQLYEGLQKGAETIEKNVQEQKEGAKN